MHGLFVSYPPYDDFCMNIAGEIPDQLQSTYGNIDPNCGSWGDDNHNPDVHICISNFFTGSCSVRTAYNS